MNTSADSLPAPAMSRRDALKPAALLLGVAISPSILAGVARAQAATPKPAARPAFSASQRALTSAIAERILPKTDTPGAIEAGVPAFIELMVGEYLTLDEKGLFLAGLIEVEGLSMTKHRRAFTAVEPAQQDALLKELAAASQSKERSFFHLIKELTVVGYFTSEIVGKTVLHYDPVPGRLDGCIPLSEVGNRSWTK